MEFLQDPTLINPNLVYLLLMVGLWLGATGTYIPGTGIVEVAGAGLLILTLYLMTLVTTNWLALVVLVIGASTFFLLPLLNTFANLGNGDNRTKNWRNCDENQFIKGF
jgi:membrane-bound ClpP family serine protease